MCVCVCVCVCVINLCDLDANARVPVQCIARTVYCIVTTGKGLFDCDSEQAAKNCNIKLQTKNYTPLHCN